MTLASNISILLLLGLTFTALLTPVTATHKVNDKCTNKKYFNTLGCSESECQVLKCVEEPNGNNAYFWRVQETCQDMQCQNGACNPNFPDLGCFA